MTEPDNKDSTENRLKNAPRNENMVFPSKEELLSRPGLPEYMRVFHGWDGTGRNSEKNEIKS